MITDNVSVSPARWYVPLLFALGTLIAGMIPALIAFAFGGQAVNSVSDSALGSFWVVWIAIYPSMGIATWYIWRQRLDMDVSIPLVLFAASFIQGLTFWLSNNVQMNSVIDMTGLGLAYIVAWVYGRYSRRALYWLIPWLIWMPFTTLLKIFLWSQA